MNNTFKIEMKKKLLFFYIMLSAFVVFAQQKEEKLKQIITDKLPAEIKPYYAKKQFSLLKGNAVNVVIVKSDDPKRDYIAEQIKDFLKKKWKIEIPVVTWKEAKSSKKDIILFGTVNDNAALRQLNANFQLGNNELGYELRTIFNALDWNKNAVYIGAKNTAELSEALDALTLKIKDPNRVEHFIECKGWNERLSDSRLQSMVEGLKKYYNNNASYVLTQFAISDSLKNITNLYKMTGYGPYAKTFAKMQKVIFDNYGRTINGKKETAPSFSFHLYPQFVYLFEHSDDFTAEDRLQAAEFMRKMLEEMMLHWELKDPLRLYKESKQEYLTNHSCFASRSVSSASRYLLSRYNYEPAKFWVAVADNAFAGVAPHPSSPEDAAGYQYLVYQIFIDYALASGVYDLDFFENATFKNYIEFCKFQLNHLGYTAGFGDANPMGHDGAYTVLKYAVEILRDKEAEYLVNLIEYKRNNKLNDFSYNNAPGVESFGLKYQKVSPFKQEQYEVGNYYARPTLDKASFRSSWDRDADFLSITGINGDGYNHSHFDANGISQYIAGDKLWLWEGDYIKKFPSDQNSIVVNKDGKISDQSRSLKKRRKSSLSQILAAGNTPDKKLSLLSIMLEDYNGTNWTRNINYVAKNGFWVVDELDVTEDGNYIMEAYWRSTGIVSQIAQGYKVTQKKSNENDLATNFFLTEGSGASRLNRTVFEAMHGRKDGNLSGYKFSDKNTQYVIQRKDGGYKKGDKILFVNFMQAVPGKDPKSPTIKKIEENTYIAKSGALLRMAILGGVSNEFLEIEADICFIGPEGVVARGAKKLNIGNYKWQNAEKKDVFIALPKKISPEDLQKKLAEIEKKASLILPANHKEIKVSTKKNVVSEDYNSNVSIIASSIKQYAVGTQNGTFIIKNDAGDVVATRKFPKTISAICAVETSKGTYWAVAVDPVSVRTGEGKLYLLDKAAEIVWQQAVPLYQKRDGKITTIFTAKVKGNSEPLIIAGAQSWHYYAFSTTGKQVWKQLIFHGATVGAAGDMDGDGTDEIAAGAEYYYHSIIKDGKVLPHTITSPWVYALAVIDLNGDGLKEAVYGRGDGFLYVQTLDTNPVKNWTLNIGGKPTAIVEIKNGNTKLAVSNALGNITFVDGAGKVIKTVTLPLAVENMIVSEQNIYAVCADNYIYKLDLNGYVLEKYPYTLDKSAIHEPKIIDTGKSIHVSSGKKIFSIFR